ncbi:MAG TPA: radical SAM protein [Vitreimonas sp.]|nr:radical SAM protein [Vitreimonas sp.]
MLNQRVTDHLQNVLHHLYINPLEKCNLKCKICYTRKTSPILPNATILDFVNRYQAVEKVETITFCGGEVFALVSFPELVNTLVDQSIFVQVITNGTLDQLDKLRQPNFINLIVSLDGVESYHDANRGEGNFRKSLEFMKKAHRLGFHLEVFSILTKQSLANIDAFEASLKKELGFLPTITYHPRKPPAYLMHHPVSNIVGETNGFDFLTPDEMVDVIKTRNVFPPKELGCYQIAVMSDGKVFGCCEGVTSLGSIEENPQLLVDKLTARVKTWSLTNTFKNCLGCSQPEFMCGIKQYLQLLEA